MGLAPAKSILRLPQQRGSVTAPLGLIRRKSMSGDRFHTLAIDGGESVAAEVYHTRGKTTILEDPSANRFWIRIDQELRAPRTANGSSILVKAPSGMESESRPRGDAEARRGDNPENQCACRLTWPIDDHAGARAASAVNCTKYWTISPPRSETIHTSVGGSTRAPTGTSCAWACTGTHASTNAPIRKRFRMVAQTVSSRDGCRCEVIHIEPVVVGTWRRRHCPSLPAQPSPVARR
jgi:hypothetical protein